MSANEHSICPKCKLDMERKKTDAARDANEKYGIAPKDEYMKILECTRTKVVLQTTLAEYYEIGITEDGTFYVNYKCNCSECGFKFSHKDEFDVFR